MMQGESSQYTPEETRRGLRLGVIEGAFAFATFTLASGAILASFVYSNGMGAFEYGLLTALPFLAQLVQIPNVALMHRWPHRKALTILFASAGRLSLLGVAFALLFLPSQSLPGVVLASFVLWSVFSALAGGAWLWWMRDLVPAQRLGTYFGNRGAALVGLSAPVLFIAGFYLDWARGQGGEGGARVAFAILFTAAALLGMTSSAIMARMPHRPPRDDPAKVALRRALSHPFTDANYRRLLGWLSVWWFASTFTVPFFPVFLLIDVGLPVSQVSALLLLGIASNVVFLRLWGALSDRFGNKPVLAVSVPVLAAGLILTAAVAAAPAPLDLGLILLIQVLLAIAASGADLTAWNLAFKLTHGPSAPSFLAAASLVRAVSTGLGPVAAGTAVTLVGSASFSLFVPTGSGSGVLLLRVEHFTVLFLAGAALVLASAALLARVREEGEMPRSELLAALRTEASSEGLVPGVRHFASATAAAVDLIVDVHERAQSSFDAGLLAIAEAIQTGGETIEGGVPPPPGQP